MNNDVVKTICYGQEKYWSSRQQAEMFFLEGMMNSEGSERERYSNIYFQLKQGLPVCKDEEQGFSKKFSGQFGDVTSISGVSNVVHFDMNTFDSLEYDCWALVKKYADLCGLTIKHDYEKNDDIDFSIVKSVQDSILNIFEKAGIEFTDEPREISEINNVSLDEKINKAEKKSQIFEESKHVIWSDINIDFASWIDGLRTEYPNLSEDALFEEMINVNNNELNSIRSNLDIKMPQPIIMISNMSVGDSRAMSYNIFNSGNIKDCMYSYRNGGEHSEWYLDNEGDLRHIEVHNNGTDYNLYRMLKPDLSHEEIDAFREKIYKCKVTRDDIEKVTDRLGDKIAEVYGWDISKNKAEQEYTK